MLNKLISNLGFNAIKVLGLKTTMKMWKGLVLNLAQIGRERNLIPIDKYMSKERKMRIHHAYGSFFVNPSYVDQAIVEESYCFGSVRELYVNNCYFKYHNFDKKEIKTVVDFGANRGMFSTMCTPFAKKIVAIEAIPKYIEIIKYNVAELNGFNNIEIGNFFISNQKEGVSEFGSPFITIDGMLTKYGLTEIDFLKIDIEGGEFEIFDKLPFDRIKYLSMEVHRDIGYPQNIIDTLKKNNFDLITTTSHFDITTDVDRIDYIYAKNKSKT